METLAHPLVAVVGLVGIRINEAQAWMLAFALLFLGHAVRFFSGEMALSRRGIAARGKVVGIDEGDEAPDRPIIEFSDHRGRVVSFISYLRVDATTKAVGTQVDIVFDPRNPKRARETGRPVAKTFHYVFLTFFVLAMAGATYLARDMVN